MDESPVITVGAITRDDVRTLSLFISVTTVIPASMLLSINSLTLEEWRWRLTLIAQLSVTISSFLLVILVFYHERISKQLMRLETLLDSNDPRSADKSKFVLEDLMSAQKITWLVNVVVIFLLIATSVSAVELFFNYQGTAATSLVTSFLDLTILGFASGLFVSSVVILLIAMFFHVKRLGQHEAVLIGMSGIVKMRNDVAHVKHEK